MVGLRNAEEYHVCIDATGVVSEIAAALGLKLVPYADEIMKLLLHNLQVRPPPISSSAPSAQTGSRTFRSSCRTVKLRGA